VTAGYSGTPLDVSEEGLSDPARAVLEALRRMTDVEVSTDTARLALRVFEASRGDLRSVLEDAQGGRNVLAAGLPEDIAFATRVDVLSAVGVARPDPLRIVPL